MTNVNQRSTMNRRTGATTLQDVANEAGVSAMTVSVVMNGARSATRVSDTTRERIQEAYPPATYARLVALKNQYDPTNVFHLNQNILPSF